MRLAGKKLFLGVTLSFGLAGISCSDDQMDGNKTTAENLNFEQNPFIQQVEGPDSSQLALSGNFYPQPGACNSYYSKEYYCDGYTQLNLPTGAGSPNITPEIDTTTAPPSYFKGMQIIGSFDLTRPSIIYLHGWNVEAPNHVFGLPDQWIIQAQAAGFNTLFFHWAELSYDDTSGCPGLGWFGVGNIPCNSTHAFFKSGGASDIFLNVYAQIFSGSTAPVRIIAQSSAASLAIYSNYRIHVDPAFDGHTRPSRMDLIDPYITPGFGGNRSSPYDGQIPPDNQLPANYRSNIVTDFVSGSSCHATWGWTPPNHLSQYCQSEGMIYSLLKDYDMPTIVYSSLVGALSASDFDRVAIFQAFSGNAFQGDLTSRHTSPNAAYMFSFAPGEPAGGYDASTPDYKILTDARKQVLDRIDMSLIQTAGFDTISLLDDAYQPR